MDFKLLYKRIKLIFSNPRGIWDNILDDKYKVGDVRLHFTVPILVLISLSSFTGTLIFTHRGLSVLYPLLMAVKDFASFYLTFELAAITVTEISIAFTSNKSFSNNYKLIVYSSTPYLLAVILSRLFSSLVFINLAGLYGLLLLWFGIGIMKPVESRFFFRYWLLTLLASIIFYLATSWIILTLLDGLYFLIFR